MNIVPVVSTVLRVLLVACVMHTCDKFQKGIGEIFLSFQGGFSKMYRIYRTILNSDGGDFEMLVKSGMF